MTRDELRDRYGIAKAEVTHLESQRLGDGERHIIVWFKGSLPQIMDIGTAREVLSYNGVTDDPMLSMLYVELTIIAELEELDRQARLKSAH